MQKTRVLGIVLISNDFYSPLLFVTSTAAGKHLCFIGSVLIGSDFNSPSLLAVGSVAAGEHLCFMGSVLISRDIISLSLLLGLRLRENTCVLWAVY